MSANLHKTVKAFIETSENIDAFLFDGQLDASVQSCKDFMSHSSRLKAGLVMRYNAAMPNADHEQQAKIGHIYDERYFALHALETMEKSVLNAPFKKGSDAPVNEILARRYKSYKTDIKDLERQLDLFKTGQGGWTPEFIPELTAVLSAAGKDFKTLLQTEGLKYMYENGLIHQQIRFKFLREEAYRAQASHPQLKTAQKTQPPEKQDAEVINLRVQLWKDFGQALGKLVNVVDDITLSQIKGETPKTTRSDLKRCMENLNKKFNAIEHAGIPLDETTKRLVETGTQKANAFLNDPNP